MGSIRQDRESDIYLRAYIIRITFVGCNNICTTPFIAISIGDYMINTLLQLASSACAAFVSSLFIFDGRQK